jgi:hypothetical protein
VELVSLIISCVILLQELKEHGWKLPHVDEEFLLKLEEDDSSSSAADYGR